MGWFAVELRRGRPPNNGWTLAPCVGRSNPHHGQSVLTNTEFYRPGTAWGRGSFQRRRGVCLADAEIKLA
eukprot:5587051-Pyramimonas_sp.AAC.1